MDVTCGVYSRAATITPDGRYVRRLFEGGYYSKCGVYSRKYGNHSTSVAMDTVHIQVYIVIKN